MAKKANDAELTEIQAGILHSVQTGVDMLYRKHAAAIEGGQEDAPDKNVTISFSVKVDASKSTPKIRTRIRYSETVIDEVIDSLEDPKQPALFDAEETKSRPKKHAEPKDDDEGETE